MKCFQCNAELIKTETHNVCPNGHGKIERMENIWSGLSSIEDARRKNSMYKAQTMCLNCGWSGPLELEKGKRVRGTPCPNCECKLGVED